MVHAGQQDLAFDYLRDAQKITFPSFDRPGALHGITHFPESGPVSILRTVQGLAGATTTLFIEKAADKDGQLIACVGDSLVQRPVLSAVNNQPENMLRRRRREEGLSASLVWQMCSKGEVAILPLHGSAASTLLMACFYAAPGCPDRPGMATGLEPHLPFLRGAAGLLHEYSVARNLSAELAAALNLSGCATILVDARGDIKFANSAAGELLERGNGLRRIGTKLTATSMRDTIRLTLAIEHLTTTGDTPEVPPGSRQAALLSITTSSGMRQMVMVTASDRYSADTVVVQVLPQGADLGRLVVPACKLYGLSATETELVSLLIKGLTITEAAKAKRIQVYTARSYLKQIFDKTGTGRQADLVRLMMSCIFQTHGNISTEVIS